MSQKRCNESLLIYCDFAMLKYAILQCLKKDAMSQSLLQCCNIAIMQCLDVQYCSFKKVELSQCCNFAMFRYAILHCLKNVQRVNVAILQCLIVAIFQFCYV